jgi:HlyD family type I secretion membrane fusion protein
MLAQERLLESRRATLAGREQVLGQRVLQLEAEITGLHQVIEAQDEQIALITEEVETVETCSTRASATSRGCWPCSARAPTSAPSRRRAGPASPATSRRSASRACSCSPCTRSMRERVSEELSRVRTELAGVRSILPSREDVLTRTVVAAPLDGTVVNLRVTTESGVVRPGEPLLDLVPIAAELIIDARVKPTDMDTVRAGQEARVIFSAYGQRNMPQITGTLRSISADRLTDERTGEPYFLAKVAVDPGELERIAPEVELTPGMPAEVMILTGERTLLDYLVRPFIQSVTRSFRES